MWTGDVVYESMVVTGKITRMVWGGRAPVLGLWAAIEHIMPYFNVFNWLVPPPVPQGAILTSSSLHPGPKSSNLEGRRIAHSSRL